MDYIKFLVGVALDLFTGLYLSVWRDNARNGKVRALSNSAKGFALLNPPIVAVARIVPRRVVGSNPPPAVKNP